MLKYNGQEKLGYATVRNDLKISVACTTFFYYSHSISIIIGLQLWFKAPSLWDPGWQNRLYGNVAGFRAEGKQHANCELAVKTSMWLLTNQYFCPHFVVQASHMTTTECNRANHPAGKVTISHITKPVDDRTGMYKPLIVNNNSICH